jgi:hypothetical protein
MLFLRLVDEHNAVFVQLLKVGHLDLVVVQILAQHFIAVDDHCLAQPVAKCEPAPKAEI